VKNVVTLPKPADGCHTICDVRFAIYEPPVVCRVNRESQIVNYSTCHAIVAIADKYSYIVTVNRLTKQEQLFLIIVLGLLLTGWAVKMYRTAHPPPAIIQAAKS
jgi:hypothetical protein